MDGWMDWVGTRAIAIGPNELGGGLLLGGKASAKRTVGVGAGGFFSLQCDPPFAASCWWILLDYCIGDSLARSVCPMAAL
ncbi:hypothetical protein MUK42_28108 [Musa troglodytarum]|uniref:Uncharacterized protein n=1 Tax=Musa troglodytarum TaxID=320322 RepID=A0A9E7JUR1_9LILI|nr:hypothetical protein MUK42_28108 [Musa troglodytarum]